MFISRNKYFLKSCVHVLVVGLTCALLFQGCTPSPYRGYLSPYNPTFKEQFRPLNTPLAEDIETKGVKLTIPKDYEEVYSSCLSLLAQWEGILRCEHPAPRQAVLIFAHGLTMPHHFYQFIKKISTRCFVIALIGLEIKEVSPNKTQLTAAWLSPKTLAPTSLQSQPVAAEKTSGATKGVPLDEDDQDPINKVRHAANGVISSFFLHLKTQIEAPNRWSRKFFGQAEKRGSERVQPKERRSTAAFPAGSSENREMLNIERQYGNWLSAVISARMIVLDTPELVRLMEEMASSILSAAGINDRQVRVLVLSNPIPNAFSMPNGDIYVSSGLLNILETRDELAMVLGHELGHVVRHDSYNQADTKRTAEISKQAMQLTFGVIASVLTMGLLTPAAMGVSASMSTGQIVGLGTLSGAAQVAANISMQETVGWINDETYSLLVEGYSEESELAADEFSIRNIYTAGYDPASASSILSKLCSEEKILFRDLQKDLGIKGKARVMPALLGAKPGLEKRIERIDKLLAEMGIK